MKRFVFLLLVLCLCGCDHEKPLMADPWAVTKVDSVAFLKTHFYWKGYHFLTTDSLRLRGAIPGQLPSLFNSDTLLLSKAEPIVVVNLASVPTDSIDSLWVLVASSPETYGWIREKELRATSVPDNLISRFIHAFSDDRVMIFLTCLGLTLLFFIIQRSRHSRLQIVHFNDVKSFYPTLLCLIVSASAVLYGALQQFAPKMWEAYYYAPTLNVFAENPPPIRIFLISLWVMLIVAVAVIDDLRRLSGVVNALAYWVALSGVCMLLYLFFTLSVHIYIGYPLLLLYWYFALHRYFSESFVIYCCGHCGKDLHKLGECPSCGAINYR